MKAAKKRASPESATVLALCAASAATTAINNLFKAASYDDDLTVAADVRNAQVVEDLIEALLSVLSIERGAPHLHRTADDREQIDQMLAALTRYMESWA